MEELTFINTLGPLVAQCVLAVAGTVIVCTLVVQWARDALFGGHDDD